MAFRLSRLRDFGLTGLPPALLQWSQRVCEQIESEVGALQTADEALAAAIAAQNAAAAAAHTADWSGVNDDNGARPEDNATLGADLASNVTNNSLDHVTDTTSRKALANLAVVTGYIANNAVTNSVSAYTTGSVTVPGTGVWTDIQTATLNTTGAPLSVQACFYAGLFDVSYPTVSSGIFQVQIVRDSTVIYGPVDFSLCDLSGAMRGTGSNSYSLLDQPTAGSHTYKLQAFNNGGTCAPLARSIIVTETKK